MAPTYVEERERERKREREREIILKGLKLKLDQKYIPKSTLAKCSINVCAPYSHTYDRYSVQAGKQAGRQANHATASILILPSAVRVRFATLINILALIAMRAVSNVLKYAYKIYR